jgi:hypothetical protein
VISEYSGTGLILVLKNHYFTFFFVTVNTKPSTGYVQSCREGKAVSGARKGKDLTGNFSEAGKRLTMTLKSLKSLLRGAVKGKRPSTYE